MCTLSKYLQGRTEEQYRYIYIYIYINMIKIYQTHTECKLNFLSYDFMVAVYHTSLVIHKVGLCLLLLIIKVGCTNCTKFKSCEKYV